MACKGKKIEKTWSFSVIISINGESFPAKFKAVFRPKKAQLLGAFAVALVSLI